LEQCSTGPTMHGLPIVRECGEYAERCDCRSKPAYIGGPCWAYLTRDPLAVEVSQGKTPVWELMGKASLSRCMTAELAGARDFNANSTYLRVNCRTYRRCFRILRWPTGSAVHSPQSLVSQVGIHKLMELYTTVLETGCIRTRRQIVRLDTWA
jgi:hypothetical protein